MRSIARVFGVCAVLLLLAFRPPDAAATVVAPADLDTVVAGSQLIVRGRVVEVRSEMTAGRRSIHSVVTLEVDETLKGQSSRTVLFRVPNGQVGRYRRVVVGAPEFSAGDEVVVFLRGSGPAIPSLFGLQQGVYRVQRDDAARLASAGTFTRTVRALVAGQR